MPKTSKKKTTKQAKKTEKPVSTVSIMVLSDTLIDKRYNIGKHEISNELRQKLENSIVVKSGKIVRL